jgi:hypothetical protein
VLARAHRHKNILLWVCFWALGKSILADFRHGLLGAAWSQATSTTPKYGHGGEALAQRFGAAIGDFNLTDILSRIFATVLHQDPRYLRKGRRSSFLVRVADSLKQIVVARQDSGVKTFNASNFLGMAAGSGFSNLYYPLPAGPGRSCWASCGYESYGDAMGNLMSEFWPDVRRKFFSKKPKHSNGITP